VGSWTVALNCALRDGLIPVNPALLVKPGRIEFPLMVALAFGR
jgi:hypothetical protein